MKLEKIQSIKGIIHLLSGMHIGAGKDTVEIGGLDQPIVKNPFTNAPYIPGSSIKGKMRSLLETSIYMDKNEKTRQAVIKGSPCNCGKKNCDICVLFGPHYGGKPDSDLGPTRLLVRDALFTEEFVKLFKSNNLPMEIKYENIINRLTGTAKDPRPLERIPAGVEFDFNIALRKYEGDRPDLLNVVFTGLKLIELDALGGCSSRGCGEVSFRNITVDGKETFENLANFEIPRSL